MTDWTEDEVTPEDPIALVLAGSRTAFVAHGDCLKRLKELPDSSIDAVVTDPPAGIAFMGKAWDRMQKEGMTELQAFQEFIFEVFTEVYRVLKPGGHAVVWALPRTAHHTTMGVERAGFEIRDVVHHLFGTGFPKSLDVSKALAKSAKAAASDWQGWGTALKPAAENWILARKPLIGTVVANVLEHGTGAMNIDGTRINLNGDYKCAANGRPSQTGLGDNYDPAKANQPSTVGRWPANLVLSHSDGCVQTGTTRVKAITGTSAGRESGGVTGVYGSYKGNENAGKPTGLGGADGKEEVEAWDCVPECAVRMLDEQSGQRTSGVPGVRRREHETTSMAGKLGLTGKQETGYADSGGASRFFYVAKAPGAEKSAVMTCGCTPKLKIKDIPVISMKEAKGQAGQPCPVCGEEQQLHAHPTVKSVSLMEWLVKLVTPPGGVVLDPFTGSGTTGVAARRLGFRFIGMEQDKVYCALARSRTK